MKWFYPINGWHTGGTPVGEHPGAFGVKRKHHIHEGVDLYCEAGTAVRAVEDGEVIWTGLFTGALAGSPWWNDTSAVMIKGASGWVLYGEILTHMRMGQQVKRGHVIGYVERVLKKDKGKPTSMLHLELRKPCSEAMQNFNWQLDQPKPWWLVDPTPFLLEAQ